MTRSGGRKEWVREGRRELERRRETERRPIPNDRADRLFEAVRRLEQNEPSTLGHIALMSAGAMTRATPRAGAWAARSSRFRRRCCPTGRST